MARIVNGPLLTEQVVNKQTGSPLSGVTVTVSAQVYTDPELSSGATTTLTTNGQGVFSCYAKPGVYTFTCSEPLAAPIESVEVLSPDMGTTAGSGASSVPAGTKDLVKDYGAVGDGIVLTDAAITSGQASLTSASASFTGADVGKAIQVNGAGASGAPLVTTIAARVSSTQVTLNTTAGTTVASGGRVVYGTDNTAKLQQWLTDVTATGGTLVAPEGNYVFSGAQVTGTAFTYAYSGQVLLPARSQAQARPTWSIVGSRQPILSHFGSVLSENEPLAGGTIFTSLAVTGSFIDVIPGLLYNSTTPLTNAIFRMENVTVRTPYNVAVAALKLVACGGMGLDGVSVEVSETDGNFSAPGNFKAGSVGIYAPGVNNQTFVSVKDTAVYGYNQGLRISEHAVLDGYNAQACNNGIFIDAAGHPIIFNKVMLQWNTTHIQIAGSAAIYGSVGLESKTSGWWPTTTDIYDPSSFGRGRIAWACNGDPNYAIILNGATGLLLRNIWKENVTQAGAPLARATYNPGTQGSYSITATALTALDTTNLIVTFVAPNSGKVLVTLKNLLVNLGTAGNIGYGLLNASGGAQVGVAVSPMNGTANTVYLAPNVEIPVAGLTPGTSYTFRWAARVNTGTATAYVGGDPATVSTPATMTVWAES